jgi:hypothetical protein
MIDELEILKTIIGDITGVGIWGVVAWILYKLATAGMTLGAFIYTIKMGYALFSNPITKSESESLKDDNRRLKREADDEKHKCKSEVENIKHMYKILKEANRGNGSNGG